MRFGAMGGNAVDLLVSLLFPRSDRSTAGVEIAKKDPVNDAGSAPWLAAVREATLAAGTARISCVHFMDPAPPEAAHASSRTLATRLDAVDHAA